jgi:hypothetical protein
MSSYRTLTLVLAANEPHYINVGGDFINIRSATSAVQIALDGGRSIAYSQGETAVSPFTGFEIVSATSQTVTVLYGTGDFDGIAAEISNNVNVTVDKSNTIADAPKVSAVAASATQVAAANASRTELALSLLSSAANEVYIGSASVAAGRGTPLEPGGIHYITTTAAVYVYNPGASAVDVWVTELTNV